MQSALVSWIEAVVRQQLPILVATDLDHAIADRDSAEKRPLEAGSAVLNQLARVPRVRVAVVSRRPLEEAAVFCDALQRVCVCADHGSVLLEPTGRVSLLDPADDGRRVAALVALAREIVKRIPGADLEPKLGGVTLWLSEVAHDIRPDVLDAFRRSAWQLNAQTLEGVDYIEARYRCGDRSLPLKVLAAREPSCAVLYAGRDDADEAAYRAVARFDVGLAFHVRCVERPRAEAPNVEVVECPEAWVDVLSTVHEAVASRASRVA